MDRPEPAFDPDDEAAADLSPGVGPIVLAGQEQMATAADDGALPEREQHVPPPDEVEPQKVLRAAVPSRWTDLCPYLIDETGKWRDTRPTKEHRCTALNPPAPLRADKQRRHCLVAAHVECPIYVAALEVRSQSLGRFGQVGQIGDVADRAPRRGYARTAPVILERPAAAAVALSTLRTSLPQVGLIALMLLAVAALVLARFVSP